VFGLRTKKTQFSLTCEIIKCFQGADTSANPYIVIYGKDIHSKQANLCKNKIEKKDKFKKGSIDRFVLQVSCSTFID
jgi:hypothetical protein